MRRQIQLRQRRRAHLQVGKDRAPRRIEATTLDEGDGRWRLVDIRLQLTRLKREHMLRGTRPQGAADPPASGLGAYDGSQVGDAGIACPLEAGAGPAEDGSAFGRDPEARV